MERAIITISESGKVNIPDSNIWMSFSELVVLFDVAAPPLKASNPSHTQKRSNSGTYTTLRSNAIYLLGYPLQYGYDYSPCFSHLLILCGEDTDRGVKEDMRTKRESMLSLFACQLSNRYVVISVYRQTNKSVSLHIG